MRFSTEKYDMKALGNKFSHLTNSSINKYSPSLNAQKGIIGAGSKWTFDQLRNHLRDNNCSYE